MNKKEVVRACRLMAQGLYALADAFEAEEVCDTTMTDNILLETSTGRGKVARRRKRSSKQVLKDMNIFAGVLLQSQEPLGRREITDNLPPEAKEYYEAIKNKLKEGKYIESTGKRINARWQMTELGRRMYVENDGVVVND